MKYLLIFFLISLSNCSLNKDSQYWTEHPAKYKKNQKIINEILKKSGDITKMTLEEYEIYIDDYTKKSKYPDLSK
ncbi:hypothetical protein OAZ98_00660 [bacterium]|nr:hypothetical protein [bacterium]